jgi:hypothetical protein
MDPQASILEVQPVFDGCSVGVSPLFHASRNERDMFGTTESIGDAIQRFTRGRLVAVEHQGVPRWA